MKKKVLFIVNPKSGKGSIRNKLLDIVDIFIKAEFDLTLYISQSPGEWNVEVFGKISLTLTISNFLMVFIRAVALVLFPMLRRTKADDLSQIYNTMYLCLMIPLAGSLFFQCGCHSTLTV